MVECVEIVDEWLVVVVGGGWLHFVDVEGGKSLRRLRLRLVMVLQGVVLLCGLLLGGVL